MPSRTPKAPIVAFPRIHVPHAMYVTPPSSSLGRATLPEPLRQSIAPNRSWRSPFYRALRSLTNSSRHRQGLILTTVAVTAVAASFRYTAISRRTNEQNQCSSNPYYVSVDRSGGGI